MDTTNEEIRAISLFSGFGGLEIGVRAAIPRLRVVAYVEREAYACGLLAQKIQEGELDEAPIWTDVTTFPAERFYGKIHLVIAGYPCQDFSCAGRREGLEGSRGQMWGFTRSILHGTGAPAFIGENVDGHLSLGFDTVVSDLAEDGFKVEGGVCSAAVVGAPHLRKRIFSFAVKCDVREWGIRRESELITALGNPEGAGRESGLVGSREIELGGTSTRTNREGRGEEETIDDGLQLRGDPTGDVADHESSGRGNGGSSGGSDSGGIQEPSREIGTDLRRDAGGSGRGDGTKELGHTDVHGLIGSCEDGGVTGESSSSGGSGGEQEENHGQFKGEPGIVEYTMRGGRGERVAGDLGEKRRREESFWNQLTQEIGHSSASIIRLEESYCVMLAGLYDTQDLECPAHQLADTESAGRETRSPEPITDGGREPSGTSPYSSVRYVARPGGSQYDWEAPRVVKTGVEPGMGGEPDAAAEKLYEDSIRKDRLRLTGNGVVWLTAARAVSLIYQKHGNYYEEKETQG